MLNYQLPPAENYSSPSTMISAAAVTYFTIGGRIVDYAGQVVTTMAQVFMPMSSQSEAKGDMNRLRKIFVVGNRVCAFIIFPICAILIILGKSVIEVWMGKRYIDTSYPVLVIMIIVVVIMRRVRITVVTFAHEVPARRLTERLVEDPAALEGT